MDNHLRKIVKALLFGIDEHRRANREAVERRNATGKHILDDTFDYAGHIREIDALHKELLALLKPLAGTGFVPGRIVSFDVADGSAEYIVGNIGKETTEVIWIPGEFDDYEADAVWEGKAFTGRLRQMVEWEDGWEARHKEMMGGP